MYSQVYYIATREGMVSGNQKVTKIFIKYMHEIVLHISFLDINSQNWNSASHLNLLQKIHKGVNRHQIFLHVVDRHKKTDFLR